MDTKHHYLQDTRNSNLDQQAEYSKLKRQDCHIYFFFLLPDSQNCDFLEACVSLALWPCIANASIKMVKWDLQWPRKLLILRWMADIDLSFSQCPFCTKILSHITSFC